MKKKCILTHLLIAAIFLLANFTMLHAQTPEGLTYQAVARDGSGNLLTNQNIDVKFEIRETSTSGIVTYDEVHAVMTNDYGLFTAIIGMGTAGTGTFNTIDWGSDKHFLRVLIDTGSGFVIMGTTQFMSVPYSLMAKNAAQAESAKKATDMTLNELNDVNAATPASGDVLKWNGAAWTTAVDDTSSSIWTRNGNNLYYDTGNVGIGTNNPVNTLSVLQPTGNANTVRMESQDHPSGKDLLELIVPVGSPATSQFIEMQNGAAIVAAVHADGSAKFKSVEFEDNTVQTTAAKGPIAFGFIQSTGTISSGSGNYSVAWESTFNRYEITITGESYFFSSYTSMITPTSSSVKSFRTSSVSGKLLVYLYNASGTAIQSDFQFLTFK